MRLRLLFFALFLSFAAARTASAQVVVGAQIGMGPGYYGYGYGPGYYAPPVMMGMGMGVGPMMAPMMAPPMYYARRPYYYAPRPYYYAPRAYYGRGGYGYGGRFRR